MVSPTVDSHCLPYLTFVYLGNQIPAYGAASLSLAAETSGLEVRLIGNAVAYEKKISGVSEFIAVEDFYDDQSFQSASRNLHQPAGFREGFWFKALERFFVLEQFFTKSSESLLVHAELDQLVFRADFLAKNFRDITQTGLFVPFHTADLALGSIVIINDKSELGKLAEYANEQPGFSNEMALIAKWAKSRKASVFGLPTLGLLDGNVDIVRHVPRLHKSDIGGVVDAAQLGQWIGGIDPRNVRLPSLARNKFVDPPQPGLLTDRDLSEMSFRFDQESRLIVTSGAGEDAVLFNLHLHSKMHDWLRRYDPQFSTLFSQANSSRSVVILPSLILQIREQGPGYALRLLKKPLRMLRQLRKRTLRQLKKTIGIRPSSAPYLSGDTFRLIAQHRWERGNKSTRASDVAPGEAIFCESDFLEEASKSLLHKVNVPFVLILGNSDRNLGPEELSTLKTTTCKQVFAQNLIEEVSGVTPLPIGLENAWRGNHGVPQLFDAERQKSAPTINRIMWSFTISNNPRQREPSANALMTVSTADYVGQISPRRHRELLRRYRFVASPPGNGEDTHRTWEAMYLQCVPIALRSYASEYFASLGLPIWVVDAYTDLERLTEQDLAKKYAEFENRFSSPALWSDFWIEKINNFARGAS